MSLLWCDGFESYGTSGTEIGDVYRLVSGTPTFPDGKFGGQAVRLATSEIVTINLGNSSTVVLGLHYQAVSTIFNNATILRLLDPNGDLQLYIRILTSGELQLLRGGTLLSTTSGLGLVADTWYHFELKIVIGNSSNGSYELKVDEVQELVGAGLDTQNTGFSEAPFVHLVGAGSVSHQFDNFYVLDDLGDKNNDFLGEKKVSTHFPLSDDQAEWSPSAGGDNYALVDENPHDVDGTYIKSSDNDNEDLYGFTEACLPDATGVDGVQLNAVTRVTDAATFTVALRVEKDGNTFNTDKLQAVPSNDYQGVHLIQEYEPANVGLVDWTGAKVKANTFGIKNIGESECGDTNYTLGDSASSGTVSAGTWTGSVTDIARIKTKDYLGAAFLATVVGTTDSAESEGHRYNLSGVTLSSMQVRVGAREVGGSTAALVEIGFHKGGVKLNFNNTGTVNLLSTWQSIQWTDGTFLPTLSDINDDTFGGYAIFNVTGLGTVEVDFIEIRLFCF